MKPAQSIQCNTVMYINSFPSSITPLPCSVYSIEKKGISPYEVNKKSPAGTIRTYC